MHHHKQPNHPTQQYNILQESKTEMQMQQKRGLSAVCARGIGARTLPLMIMTHHYARATPLAHHVAAGAAAAAARGCSGGRLGTTTTGTAERCVQNAVTLPRKNSATLPRLWELSTSAVARSCSAFLTRMWPTLSVSTSDLTMCTTGAGAKSGGSFATKRRIMNASALRMTGGGWQGVNVGWMFSG